MKTKIVLFGMILCLLFTSICFAEETATENAVLATAKNGEITVTADEVRGDFEDAVNYYIYLYSMYGQTIDEYDTELQEMAASTIVENAIDVKIAAAWAEENGYTLSDEDIAEFEAHVSEEINEIRESYREYLVSYGIGEDQIEEVLDEEMAASGYTPESLLESEKLQKMLEFIANKASEDVTVTEADAEAEFSSELEQQKADYDADKDSFVDVYLSGGEYLYIPDGIRIVKVIYTALEAEDTEIEETETEGSAEETEETAEAAETEAATEEAADIADLTGLARAQAIAAAIADGRDFDEMMVTYNEDTSTPEEMELGYPVFEGSSLYSQDFTDAAMALEKIGDISDVLVTDYGYFIIKYDRDLETWEAAFEDHKDELMETALETKKQEAYSALIAQILEEANIEIKDLTVLYHVYVGEDMVALEAYGLTAAETELLDKPEGEAVAKLAEGTSVQVLGYTDVNGVNYAFVSVLGTETKGYVKSEALSDATQADAEANDNADKVELLETESKVPVFTIAMRDGAIIYGELYPEIAPESVGNFVELANSNFYDGVIFHRVIPGFVIQGGDPDGNGTGGPGYSIKGEFTDNNVENTLSHERGVLSMARSAEYDSAGSQFFIMHADNTGLDGQYAAFGKVLGGLDEVDVIASVPTDSSDKPRNDQVIGTVYVETHGETYPFTKLTTD